MIQIQGFQYDLLYYQLHQRSVQESCRDSHIHLASILSCSGDTMEHCGALTVTLQVDIPPSQQHPLIQPQPRSHHER